MNDKHIAKAREIVLEQTGFRRDYPNATWEEIMALAKIRSRHRMGHQEAEAWVYVIAKALAQTEATALARAAARCEE